MVAFLHDELKRRVLKNSNYSLRAFSRDLGVSPSKMSKVLNRKAELTEYDKEQFAASLGLSDEQIQLYKEKHSLSGHYVKGPLRWFYGLIRETIILYNGEISPKELARKLQFTEDEINEVLESFESLNILTRDNDKLIIDTTPIIFKPQIGSLEERDQLEGYRHTFEFLKSKVGTPDLANYKLVYRFPASQKEKLEKLHIDFFQNIASLCQQYKDDADSIMVSTCNFATVTKKD